MIDAEGLFDPWRRAEATPFDRGPDMARVAHAGELTERYTAGYIDQVWIVKKHLGQLSSRLAAAANGSVFRDGEVVALPATQRTPNHVQVHYILDQAS